jgi:O-antigen/teichoic acid export membrane protein
LVKYSQEKFFVIVRSKLFGNAVIYLGANILNAGIPFLLLPILTRALTPTDYGTVTMFGIVLNVMGAFTGLSVHGAVGVRYFHLEKNALAEYVGACVGILLSSTATLFLLVVVFGEWLTKTTGVPSNWILFAVVLSGFQFLGNIRLALWQVSGEAKKYGTFQVTQSLLNAVATLVLILVVGMAWEGRVLGQAVAVMLFGIIALWWLLKDGLIRHSKAWRVHSRDALKFGLPLIPHVIGGLLIVAADRFVIVRLLDVAQAGIYMVALQVGQALGLMTESFNKAYAPWLMRNLLNSPKDLRIKIVRGTYLYFVLVLTIAVIFGLSAPLFLGFLVGESFRTAGELVIYIALGFAFGGCYFMVTNYVFFESKTRILAFVTLVVGLVNIPLMFILVEQNGIIGAGQAFMLTNAFSFIATWWLAQKIHPMPWLKAFRSTTS